MAEDKDEMRDEYDFTNAARGKYVDLYRPGSNIVVLDPDVARRFKTSAEVNEGLRRVAAADSGPVGSPR